MAAAVHRSAGWVRRKPHVVVAIGARVNPRAAALTDEPPMRRDPQDTRSVDGKSVYMHELCRPLTCRATPAAPAAGARAQYQCRDRGESDQSSPTCWAHPGLLS